MLRPDVPELIPPRTPGPRATFLCGLALASLVATPARAEPLTLEEAVAQGLEAAEEVIVARGDLLLVDTEWVRALSQVLPRVDLSFVAGEVFGGSPIFEARFSNAPARTLPGELPAFIYGPFIEGRSNNYSNPRFSVDLRASQLIYDGGRWWTTLARVEDLGKSREAALQAVKRDVTFLVTDAFYRHEKSTQALRVLELQLEMDDEQLVRAEALVSAGRGTRADLAAAARNRADDRITLRNAALDVRRARRALNLAMGRDPRTETVLAIPAAVRTASGALDRPELPNLDALLELALSRHPQVIVLAADIAVAQKDVRIEESGFWPSISLEASYSRNSRRPDRVFADPTQNYYAGLDLVTRWNLFEGRANSGRVEAAEIRLRQLSARKDAVVRRVTSDVEDALDSLNASVDAYGLAKQSVDIATEAMLLARGLYTVGRGTLLEQRDAELGLTQAKLRAIDARLDVETARAAVARAVGELDSL